MRMRVSTIHGHHASSSKQLKICLHTHLDQLHKISIAISLCHIQRSQTKLQQHNRFPLIQTSQIIILKVKLCICALQFDSADNNGIN
jgi:hypothetical protein